MADNDAQFQLPTKIGAYLQVLSKKYHAEGQATLREIVVNGVPSVVTGWDYDNWDGGIHGHALTLGVPEDLYLEVMDDKEVYEGRIEKDINELKRFRSERISKVYIEFEPVETDNWREESGVFRQQIKMVPVSVEALKRIWGDGHVRVFLSHRDTFKREAAYLKESLARCGISSFVAHEDIKPTRDWMQEIERALRSMDALVALLTEDFHSSVWTNQEVGFAMGSGVPVIPICLGQDPLGLLGKYQGVKGCDAGSPIGIASHVFALLSSRLSDNSRLFECALSAYANASDFDDSTWKVEHLLSVFESVSQEQIELLVDAHQRNAQTCEPASRAGELLGPLFKKWTGEDWDLTYEGCQTRRMKQQGPADEDIPF